MPAKSKSQQRLMGMVHAYNKGEFHGTPKMEAFVRRISDSMSKKDVEHFARTSHSGLPDTTSKRAEDDPLYERMRANVEAAYGAGIDLAKDEYNKRKRESEDTGVLGTALHDAIVGTGVMGVAGALLGAMAHPKDGGAGGRTLIGDMFRGAMWGMPRGTILGGSVGTARGVLGQLR